MKLLKKNNNDTHSGLGSELGFPHVCPGFPGPGPWETARLRPHCPCLESGTQQEPWGLHLDCEAAQKEGQEYLLCKNDDFHWENSQKETGFSHETCQEARAPKVP